MELQPLYTHSSSSSRAHKFELIMPVYLLCYWFWNILQDLAVTVAFYVKFFCLYAPMFGFFGAFAYHFILRFAHVSRQIRILSAPHKDNQTWKHLSVFTRSVLESHWFVWVSQSNHLPMEIDEDRQLNWLELQTHATCNIERSAFNDWFTGHLNFQIEHQCACLLNTCHKSIHSLAFLFYFQSLSDNAAAQLVQGSASRAVVMRKTRHRLQSEAHGHCLRRHLQVSATFTNHLCARVNLFAC